MMWLWMSTYSGVALFRGTPFSRPSPWIDPFYRSGPATTVPGRRPQPSLQARSRLVHVTELLRDVRCFLLAPKRNERRLIERYRIGIQEVLDHMSVGSDGVIESGARARRIAFDSEPPKHASVWP